jgi:hypothetical protein
VLDIQLGFLYLGLAITYINGASIMERLPPFAIMPFKNFPVLFMYDLL